MIVSAAVRTAVQFPLWPDEGLYVRTAGELRWLVGDFFEAATAALPGMIRHRTDSRAAYCPDLRYGGDGGPYVECKAVGNSGHVIAYDCRLAKDAEFVAGGRGLWYWVWHHRCRATSYVGRTRAELYAGLAASLRYVVAVPWSAFSAVADTYPSRVLNSGYAEGRTRNRTNNERCGYITNGYGVGKAVRVKVLRERAAPELWVIPPILVRGTILPPADVYAPPGCPLLEW